LKPRGFKFYNERAVQSADCPQCLAKKGEKCRGSLGYPIEGTHYNRRRAAAKLKRGGEA
jgi:hypothetical protein